MISIPKTITPDFVNSLSAADLREIFENASDTVIDEVISLLPQPTEKDYEEAHQFLDDGIYDSKGNLIGEKHPED